MTIVNNPEIGDMFTLQVTPFLSGMAAHQLILVFPFFYFIMGVAVPRLQNAR